MNPHWVAPVLLPGEAVVLTACGLAHGE